jgi:hypothetical protein
VPLIAWRFGPRARTRRVPEDRTRCCSAFVLLRRNFTGSVVAELRESLSQRRVNRVDDAGTGVKGISELISPQSWDGQPHPPGLDY